MKALSTVTLLGCITFFSFLNAQSINPDSLYDLGQHHYAQAEYDQAIEHFQSAETFYLQKGDSLKWADAVLMHISTLIDKGEIKPALDMALNFADNKPLNSTLTIEAYSNYYIGWAYRLLEEYENSINYYLKGLQKAEESRDSILIGRLNNNISYPYLFSGNYEKAHSHQMKAKEIYEATGQTRRLSNVLNGIFLTLTDYGLSQQAEKYIRQSMAIRKEIGNPNLLDIAYHNMAVNLNSQGKTDSAIIYYQKSLELSRMLNNPYDITQTLINIGNLYKKSGNTENALMYYNEALEYNLQTDRPVSIADNLLKIADVAVSQGNFSTAESFYEDALARLKDAASPVKLVNTYFELAEMNIKQERYATASEYISLGHEVASGNDLTPLVARANQLYGDIEAAKGNYRKSLAHYRLYYKLKSQESLTFSINPAIDLARAYQRVHSDSAFIFAEKAFERIDSVRTNVAGVAFRAGFFSDYAAFYYEVASWYIKEKGNNRKAYELVEAAKARVLMDELAEAENKIYQQLDESTLIKKQQMLKQIDRLHGQINESEDQSKKEALRNELKDLEFQYQTFLNEIRAGIPGWKDFDYPEPLTAPEVMHLLDERSAILEYAFTENSLICFTISQDDIYTSVIDSVNDTSTRVYLNNEIRAFRTHITEEEPVNSDFYSLSETLYEHLIPAEVLRNAPEITQLVIVPDAGLTFLPFEVIRGNDQYLIEKYSIKYLPSASIYPFIRPPHRETNFDLLAVAGSGFESASNPGAPSRSQANYASLPSTLLEVDSIAVNFKNAKVLKNEDVTEVILKSHDLGDYRFLHFATHGNIDETNPSQSGLILSSKMETESLFGEDGYLNSAEISGLRLNADLVTLSACNTGMGKIITGEGLLGLQRSFLSAGASSVIVSLWSIYDRSTSEFMAKFYKTMLEYQMEDYGLFSQALNWAGLYSHPMFDYKTKALREAKLAMINHPYYNHPVHWAPFILIGK